MQNKKTKSDNTNEDNENEKISLKVDSKTKTQAEDLINADFSNLIKRREIVKRIDNFAVESLNLAESRSKNLSSTISKMTQDTTTDNELDSNLEKLEREIRTLDPSMINFSKIKKGIGKLFDPVTKYFSKFEQEEGKIEDIINSLNVGRNILSNDNITLDLEMEKIANTIMMLESEYEAGNNLKEQIQKFIDEAIANGESKEKTDFYENEVVVPLEKKLFDIKQIIIVNRQSSLAMEIIRKNNKELIRNVDKIKNVTLVAVNTACMVAKSIYNQKIILKKINAMDNSTNNLIKSTSQELKKESESISAELKHVDISIDGLKNSFSNAFAVFDEVLKQNGSKEIEQKINEIMVKE